MRGKKRRFHFSFLYDMGKRKIPVHTSLQPPPKAFLHTRGKSYSFYHLTGTVGQYKEGGICSSLAIATPTEDGENKLDSKKLPHFLTSGHRTIKFRFLHKSDLCIDIFQATSKIRLGKVLTISDNDITLAT